MRVFIWLYFLFFPLELFAFVHAQIDNTKISENQVITLVLETDQTKEEPRLDVLDQNFKMIGSGRSTQVNMMNGAVSQQTNYRISLLPKRSPTGANPLILLIPAITIGNEQSEPVTLEIYPAGQLAPSRESSPIMVTGDLSSHSAMPGEQLVYTFRLYITPQAVRGVSQPYLKQPDQTGLDWVPLGELIQREERREGILYEVMEQKFALFAHEVGEIEVSGVVFSALMQDDRNAYTLIAQTHPFQLSAPSQHLSVQAFPSDIGDQHPLVASSLWAQEEWSITDPHLDSHLKVGELLTRTVHLQAKGAKSEQLPEMPILKLVEVNIYPSPPTREKGYDRDELLGKSTQKIAYMFTQAGDYELPETQFPFWNSHTHQMDIATLPARSIHIEAAEQANIKETLDSLSQDQTSNSKPYETSSDSLWKWIALGALLLWGVSVGIVVWILQRKKKEAQHQEMMQEKMPLLKRINQAIQSKNYAVLSACLIEWGAQELRIPCRSLGDLAQVVQGVELKNVLQTLEQNLYSGIQSEISISILLMLLKQEKRQMRRAQKQGPSLSKLYPSD